MSEKKLTNVIFLTDKLLYSIRRMNPRCVNIFHSLANSIFAKIMFKNAKNAEKRMLKKTKAIMEIAQG